MYRKEPGSWKKGVPFFFNAGFADRKGYAELAIYFAPIVVRQTFYSLFRS